MEKGIETEREFYFLGLFDLRKDGRSHKRSGEKKMKGRERMWQ